MKILMSLILTVALESAHAAEIHVTPTGDDVNPGTAAKPLATLAGAQSAVRKLNKAMTEDIVVSLRGGLYPLSKTVEFGPDDSGFNGHKVIYRAVGDEVPILHGGLAVTQWELVDKLKRIYRATVPKTVFRQVYIDGERGIRSRTPNRTSNHTLGPYWRMPSVDMTTKRFPLNEEQWAACSKAEPLEEVEMVLISQWYQQRLRIGNVIPMDKGATFTPVKPEGKLTKPGSFYANSSFYLENALSFVDAPGEWYHDPRTGTLYLCLAEGVDSNELRVTIPLIPTLIDIRGTADSPVKDIEIQGLTFETSNWTSPSENGLNITQFAQPIGVERVWENPDCPPGMIRAEHARHIALRKNVIRNAGAHGIQFFADVDDSDLEGNRIYNIAANGIEIDSHAKLNPADSEQSRGVAIWNNEITRCGQDYTNGGGILAHNVRGLIVEHNLIHDMPYSGMQIGQQPGKMQDIGCGENQIRYNHVHQCNQIHGDGGGIYTLGGIQNGSVIAGNYIHDINQPKDHYKVDWIYLDNFSSGIQVRDNVVTGGRAAERNGSRENKLENNVDRNPEIESNAGIKPGYKPRGK